MLEQMKELSAKSTTKCTTNTSAMQPHFALDMRYPPTDLCIYHKFRCFLELPWLPPFKKEKDTHGAKIISKYFQKIQANSMSANWKLPEHYTKRFLKNNCAIINFFIIKTLFPAMTDMSYQYLILSWPGNLEQTVNPALGVRNPTPRFN